MAVSCPLAVPPNIVGTSETQDVSVLLGGQVTLECRSDAVPPPTLSWLKDGHALQVGRRSNKNTHTRARTRASEASKL